MQNFFKHGCPVKRTYINQPSIEYTTDLDTSSAAERVFRLKMEKHWLVGWFRLNVIFSIISAIYASSDRTYVEFPN